MLKQTTQRLIPKKRLTNPGQRLRRAQAVKAQRKAFGAKAARQVYRPAGSQG